jgi:PAS domain S-box-containing protein
VRKVPSVAPSLLEGRREDAGKAREALSGPAPKVSAEEAGRLRALARYAIVDSPRDEAFDDLAELARGLTSGPIAGIGFFEADRVWFKALVGAEAEQCSREQLMEPRSGSCAEAAGELARCLHRGAVVSAPCVTADGFTLGCIFVAGVEPRELDEPQRQALVSLARQVVRLLELRRTLLSYHTVVDGAGHVVFHLDQADRLVSLTPTWSQLSGFGVVRSVGAPLQDFLHREDRESFRAWLTQVRTTAVPPVAQCRLVRLTQDEVPVEVLARPLVDEGQRVRGVVGVIADVSERHAREVEAQHLQRLEALGRLSAGLAHEINTPIQFVGDNARFLAESYESMLKLVQAYRRVLESTDDSPEWAQRRLEIQHAEEEADLEYLTVEVPSAVGQSLDGVERVASLVRAMKTFSHPGTGGQSEADLNEALRATITVARNQFRYIADAELDLGELPPVVCNVGDLNQVFLNMVINAADAIEEKGEHGRITVKTFQDGDHAVITIADTGTGVPESLRRKIFEPFFTTKSVGRGTGQGLALVRAVIEQHAGSVALQTEPGVGSTFTIRLPVQGRPSETEVPA